MTIVYTSDRPSTSPVYLAGEDEAGMDDPLGLGGGGETVVQLDNIVDAEKPAVFDRGNDRVSYSFTRKTEHADYEAAVAYWITHIQACLGTGTVVLTQDDAVLTLEDATVKAEGESQGASMLWRYQISGNVA